MYQTTNQYNSSDVEYVHCCREMVKPRLSGCDTSGAEYQHLQPKPALIRRFLAIAAMMAMATPPPRKMENSWKSEMMVDDGSNSGTDPAFLFVLMIMF
jgi:hypothetical protein